MPSGIEILATKLIYSKVESLTKLINCALYSVELESLPENAEKKINELLNTRELSVVRIKGEEKKQIEVGHLIHDLNIEDHHLNMLLGVSPDGYIRPAEVLTFGLGMNEIDVQMLVFHRVGQYRIQGVRKADPFDMV
jgi:hypothetical protein